MRLEYKNEVEYLFLKQAGFEGGRFNLEYKL
jgi:hypothetical protein